jgi:hypothetical protein
MSKKIFPRYIHPMYYYLLSMSDNELDDFYINDSNCRNKLFDAMRAEFESFGPISKNRIREFIEFIIFSGRVEEFWGYVVPHEIPLDEVQNKEGYLRDLYERLMGFKLPLHEYNSSVEIVKSAGPQGIDVRL